MNKNPQHYHPRPNGDATSPAVIEPRRRLALLVDARNVSPSWIPKILDIASDHGEVVVRRAFGVLEKRGWIEALVGHAIQPVRRGQASAGKNTADIELAIAAVDMLSDIRIDGYCLVSSDTDFVPLALRLREAGRFVVGIGEWKTPEAFVGACDDFSFLDEPDALRESQTAEAVADALRRDFVELLARAVDLAKR